MATFNYLADTLNAKMREWSKQGRKGNAVRKYESMLKNFYEREGISVRNPNIVTKSKKLSPEQRMELYDIMQAGLEDEYIDIKTYDERAKEIQEKYGNVNLETIESVMAGDLPKGYEKLKEQYSQIKQPEDLIGFIDEMNAYRDNGLLSAILSSDEYIRLESYAKDKHIPEEQLIDRVFDRYEKLSDKGRGMTRNIYNIMVEDIRKYDRRKKRFKGR